MKITTHTKKKTGQKYWMVEGLTDEQKLDLLARGWETPKFGNGLICRQQDIVVATIDGAYQDITAETSDEDVEETGDSQASTMTVNELRKAVRAAGWTGAEVLDASKADLVKFLETGEKPVKQGVSTAEMGLQFVELMRQISGTAGVDEDAVRLIVAQEMKNAVHRIEIMHANGKAIPVGIQHNKFETLFRIASVKVGDEGKQHRPLDVMLIGPAGSGKTTACHAVADALGIEFYAFSVGMQTTKSDLLGYMDAMGHYIASVLFKAYRDGGLFLLDEVDAGNSNVLTILNAMLANGSYIFPNGERVSRHEDFVCFAAANTYGLGGDRAYIGRNQLDAATLDRFVSVDFGYDEALERIISGGTPKGGKAIKIGGATCGADEWIDRVQAYRAAAAEVMGTERDVRIVVSPRASQKGVLLLAAGFGLDQVEDMLVWKGTSKAIVQKIKNAAKL